jgi:hypothetical protein
MWKQEEHQAMVDTLLTPLAINVPLVDPATGNPTPYFQRLLQQLLKEKKITDDLAEGAVQGTRQVIAGDGLTGGGDLSDDRTLNVGAGTGITVSADAVAADPEYIRDIIGTALVAGTNITITVNDGSDTITIASSGGSGSEWTEIKLTSDYVNATTSFTLVTDGTHSFSWTPPANKDIEIEVESYMQTAAAANLPRLQIVVPGAANNTQYGYAWISESQSVSAFSYQVVGFGTGGGTADFTSGAFASSSGVYPGIGRVKVRTGSSPAAIVVNAAAESAAANACTIKAGSRFRYRVLA